MIYDQKLLLHLKIVL